MNNLFDLERIKEGVDLYTLAARHTTLTHWARRESAGPCPRCGGKDRFHVYDDGGQAGAGQWWKCYRCHPRPGDAIEFIRWLDGCDFATALGRLAGLAGIPLAASSPRPASRGQAPPAQLPLVAQDQALPPDSPAAPKPAPTAADPTWQARAQREVAAAAHRLWRPEGDLARRYLAARGLFPLTWRAWELGFAYAWHPRRGERRPAVTIPWREGSKIMAVQYRFVSALPARMGSQGGPAAALLPDVAHGDRFSQKPGGVRRVYGLPMLECCAALQGRERGRKAPGRPAAGYGEERALRDGGWQRPAVRTLLMVEGEFNALSIWQALHDPGPWAVPPAFRVDPADVVSFGSESGATAHELAELAACYDRAILWADRAERAAEGAALLRGLGVPARAVSSPDEMDANDLLAAGLLVQFLAAILQPANVGPG